MKITFVDFHPEVIQPAGLFHVATLESLQSTTARMNQWINDNDVDIINVETVVLPNLNSPSEEGTCDSEINVDCGFLTSYNQFFRIWHRTGE